MAQIRLEGVFPPIPTPFDDSGEIETAALLRNLEHWANFPLSGFVVLGSNGEFIHLSESEALHVFDTARKGIPSDRLMIAGVGRASTRETIIWSRHAAMAGADAALVLPPSFFRTQMTSEVLVNHYRMVAEKSSIPVILYNMPACTGIDLDAETVLSLSEHENIVGLKDSGGNATKLGEIRRYANQDFAVLAGSAGFLVPALAIGASGGIMALANIAPRQCLAMYEAARNGDWNTARAIQLKLIRANRAVTRGWGVPALKAAMDMLGLYGGDPRAPLVPLPDIRRSELLGILVEAGIVQNASRR